MLPRPRRAAHALAERGAGCHLLGEDERDLASPTRLLAAGGDCDVSLTAVAPGLTPACLFSYQPGVISQRASRSSGNSRVCFEIMQQLIYNGSLFLMVITEITFTQSLFLVYSSCNCNYSSQKLPENENFSSYFLIFEKSV